MFFAQKCINPVPLIMSVISCMRHRNSKYARAGLKKIRGNHFPWSVSGSPLEMSTKCLDMRVWYSLCWWMYIQHCLPSVFCIYCKGAEIVFHYTWRRRMNWGNLWIGFIIRPYKVIRSLLVSCRCCWWEDRLLLCTEEPVQRLENRAIGRGIGPIILLAWCRVAFPMQIQILLRIFILHVCE